MSKEKPSRFENIFQDKLLRSAGLTVFALIALLGLKSCQDYQEISSTDYNFRHGGITVNNPYVETDNPSTPIATAESLSAQAKRVEEYVRAMCPSELQDDLFNYLSSKPVRDGFFRKSPNRQLMDVIEYCNLN